MIYHPKSRPIEATLWFKNGDHPNDDVMRPFEDTGKAPTEPREGAVVRYYRMPAVKGDMMCPDCGIRMHDHGWIYSGDHGHLVHPGDFVITGPLGEIYSCHPFVFHSTYYNA